MKFYHPSLEIISKVIKLTQKSKKRIIKWNYIKWIIKDLFFILQTIPLKESV